MTTLPITETFLHCSASLPASLPSPLRLEIFLRQSPAVNLAVRVFRERVLAVEGRRDHVGRDDAREVSADALVVEPPARGHDRDDAAQPARSEEHTSELQSRQ